jgi:hypothetical protein
MNIFLVNFTASCDKKSIQNFCSESGKGSHENIDVMDGCEKLKLPEMR